MGRCAVTDINRYANFKFGIRVKEAYTLPFVLKELLLSKCYPACHLDTNRIKPGKTSNMTDKHAAKYRKTVFGYNLICPCNNIDRSIDLLDKNAISDFTCKFLYK